MNQINLNHPIRYAKLAACRQCVKGFSLVELLVAAAVGVLVVTVAGDALLFHVRWMATSESLQRQRESASRTSSFIESEIAHSQGVITSTTGLDLSSCGLTASEFRFGLKMPAGLAPVIYGVKARTSITSADYGSADDWNGTNLLIRCGPDIAMDGTYQAPASAADSRTVLVDNLTASASGGGFSLPSSNSKSVSFLLALDGLAVSVGTPSTYLAQAGGTSHTNPPLPYPSSYSGCDQVCNLTSCDTSTPGLYAGTLYADTISAAQVAANTLVCGRGGGDRITGSSSDQAIDPGRTASATVSGGGGKDVLFGSAGNDSLSGGDLADILVGRNGNDTLSGAGGDDVFYPWTEATVSATSSTVISGGAGDDIVFFPGTKASDFTIGSCTQASCTVTASDGGLTKTVTMSNVEELVFTDGRYPVP